MLKSSTFERFSDAACDAETLRLMERVFDDVWDEVQTLPPDDAWPVDVANTLAIRILAAVAEGERDQGRLKKWALNALDGSQFKRPESRPDP